MLCRDEYVINWLDLWTYVSDQCGYSCVSAEDVSMEYKLCIYKGGASRQGHSVSRVLMMDDYHDRTYSHLSLEPLVTSRPGTSIFLVAMCSICPGQIRGAIYVF